MAASINASTSAGLVQSADTTGNLNIQSNGTTKLAVTSTGAAVAGTNTNDSAAAGYVGEYVSGVLAPGSGLALTNNTPLNVIVGGISLTAGDWDVSALCGFSWGSTTVVTSGLICLSEVSATLDQTAGRALYFAPQATAGSNLNFGAAIPPYRFSLSGTTTIYLVTQCTFSVSSLAVFGRIAARRVR
jgi:hypothetical protein